MELIKRKIKSIVFTSRILMPLENLTSIFVKNNISILCMHFFKKDFDDRIIKNNIKFLKEYCNTISFSKAMYMIENKLSIPKNTVVITVDDATKFFYNNVAPLLIDSGLPFTVGVIPGLIKSENREYLIAKLMRIAGHEFYLSNEEMIKCVSSKFQTYGISKVNSFEQVFSVANNLSNDRLLDVINYMKVPDDEFMSWNDLKKLKNFEKIEFASHTMGHPYLKFATGKWLDWEICRSKKILEKELSINIDSLVIPYGSVENVTKELRDALKKYEYKYVLVTDSGIVSYNTDLYMIPRINGDVKEDVFRFHCCPGICRVIFNRS